ncbi:MAG: NYN domain-containing protein [Deltaproteobacteria bacterium]|nr:NYN domain-containing protein [Deltaproteobacteria bacterium]
MALEIIIDGYNLIGSERGLHGDLEALRRQLIRKLQEYRRRRGYRVTVVFDGWRSGWSHEVEEIADGITVIYSRHGEKADDVIKRLAREKRSSCLVVSSDREVRQAVDRAGAVAIYASDFSAKLENLHREPVEAEEQDNLEVPRKRDKKGNPRRLPKKERRRRERLRKL